MRSGCIARALAHIKAIVKVALKILILEVYSNYI